MGAQEGCAYATPAGRAASSVDSRMRASQGAPRQPEQPRSAPARIWRGAVETPWRRAFPATCITSGWFLILSLPICHTTTVRPDEAKKPPTVRRANMIAS